jgi:hypothetical protein
MPTPHASLVRVAVDTPVATPTPVTIQVTVVLPTPLVTPVAPAIRPRLTPPAPQPPSGDVPVSRIGCWGKFNGCFFIVFQRSPQSFTYAYTTNGSYYYDLVERTQQMLNFGQMHAGQNGLVITNDRTEALNWIVANKTDPEYLVRPEMILAELEHNASRYYPTDRWDRYQSGELKVLTPYTPAL